jgi:hypothetical protein
MMTGGCWAGPRTPVPPRYIEDERETPAGWIDKKNNVFQFNPIIDYANGYGPGGKEYPDNYYDSNGKFVGPPRNLFDVIYDRRNEVVGDPSNYGAPGTSSTVFTYSSPPPRPIIEYANGYGPGGRTYPDNYYDSNGKFVGPPRTIRDYGRGNEVVGDPSNYGAPGTSSTVFTYSGQSKEEELRRRMEAEAAAARMAEAAKKKAAEDAAMAERIAAAAAAAGVIRVPPRPPVRPIRDYVVPAPYVPLPAPYKPPPPTTREKAVAMLRRRRGGAKGEKAILNLLNAM